MTEQKDPWGMTLRELIEVAKSWGALAQMSEIDPDGNPTATVICVVGAEECREIGAAVAAVQNRWDLRRELDKQGEE